MKINWRIDWKKEPWYSIKEFFVSIGAYLLALAIVLIAIYGLELFTKLF